MKITANKVSAIVFTLVAVTAFTWMTLRPRADIKATGFALASNTTAKTTTADTTDTPPAQDATPNSDNTNADTSEEATPATPVDEKSEQTTEITDDKKDNNTPNDQPENTTDDTPASDTTTDKAPVTPESLKTEPPEMPNNQPTEKEKPAEPIATNAPTTETDNAEEQATEKKKTDSDISSSTTEQTADAPSSPQTETAAITESAPNAETSAPIENTTQLSQTPKTTEAVDSKTITPPETTATTVASTQATPQPVKKEATATYISAENARGTVIMLHGCDYNPAAQDNIMQALRKSLPKRGWNTRILQLPTLSTSSTYKDLGSVMKDAATQIEKNIAKTKAESQTPVVLLAHSCGSHMALAWMEKRGSDSIDAYIGIGTGIMNTSAEDAKHLSNPMEKMTFPQLDIFGSTDNETVKNTARQRLASLNRAANPASRQKIIINADHNMTGKADVLSNEISKWLNRMAFKK
jgi:alpha-beta hydrolase superfamily lysophospholipase